MERRDTAPAEPHDLARVGLTLRYARPAAAARWLADAFGFESPSALPEGEDPLSDDKYGFPWIEFHVGNASLVIEPARGRARRLTNRSRTCRGCSSTTSRRISSAREGRSQIAQEIQKHGFTSYVALDLEGRRWRFAQARPTQPG